MEELIQWYNQISCLPKLNITSAQELYKKAITTNDESLKKQYMNELILGTLYVVYEYIKRNDLEILISTSYDMNDIISSFNSAWIKKIYNGELLNVNRYSLLFTSSYFNEVNNNLCSDEIIINEQLGISTDCLIELIALYIYYKNKGINKSFSEVIKNNFFTKRYNRWSYTYDKLIKVIPILEGIYNNLNFDKLEDLNIGKTKIANYLKLIINIGLLESISNDYQNNNDIEDSIATNILMEDLINDIDNSLTNERERKIIHERYGLDNGNILYLSDVGKIHNLSKDRIRQIEAKAFRKLRSRREFNQKYKGVVI